jgi:hypothetical protein
MGFLSKLLGMPSFNGATNALLVELSLLEFTESQRTQLKGRVIDLYRTHRAPAESMEVTLVEMNQMPRFFQLNLVALAMKDLGYQPPLKKEKLQKVRDPFDPNHADARALNAVARRLKWQHGIEIWIREEPISFDSW